MKFQFRKSVFSITSTDNLRVNHGKKVAAWLEAQAGVIELESTGTQRERIPQPRPKKERER